MPRPTPEDIGRHARDVLEHGPDVVEHSRHALRHGRDIIRLEKGERGTRIKIDVDHLLEFGSAALALGFLARKFWKTSHPDQPEKPTE